MLKYLKKTISYKYLLVIGILLLSFSLSFIIRSQPAEFGFELHGSDPFFNYRATNYLVENGLVEYLNWNDELSWYPHGRNISATSQVMLHLTTATLYDFFGFGSSLYEFVIVFPVIIGSLTTIVVFALVRKLGGTTAGLFASLLFAVSPSIISRGSIGWFRSEPLGLFYGLLSIYLFISGIQDSSKKFAAIKLIGAGGILAFGFSAWGGVQFFILPLAIFFIVLPFLQKTNFTLIWSIPLFVGTLFFTSLLFERPGMMFVTGFGGATILGSMIIMITIIILQNIRINKKLKTCIISGILGVLVVTAIMFVQLGIVVLPYERYIFAIDPFASSSNPLISSVSEHSAESTYLRLATSSTLTIFSIIGMILLVKPAKSIKTVMRNDMRVFTVIISITGIFVSFNLARLIVFEGIAIIILSSIGLSFIMSFLVNNRRNYNKTRLTAINYVALGVAFIIVISPVIFPLESNWVTIHKTPPMILNGGTNLYVSTQDWSDSMEWIKNNTPEDAVIAAWWDYGYWISTLGERRTLADGATFDYPSIPMLAKAFLDSPQEGLHTLQENDVDYQLILKPYNTSKMMQC